MTELRETQRVGLDYLQAVTALLQRVRRAHPTKGLYEAADFQWWWRQPRPTDDVPQLFWCDAVGAPQAAVIVTEWSSRVALDPVVMPDAPEEWISHVVGRGVAHARDCGFDAVELEVAQGDDDLRRVLYDHGFELAEEGMIEAWLAADDRPTVGSLPGGYRLSSRRETVHRPHHMVERSHPDVERRLLQTSLYRPDLDLVVFDGEDDVAAYGLFWYDAETATGLVEPMRTEDDHQQRGLARHILTTGVDLLAKAGAERVKICFEPGNPASSHLYPSVGFVPVKQTDVFSGSVGSKAAAGAT